MDLIELTPEIIVQIDENLVSICEGNSDTNIELAKKNLHTFLEPKDERTKIGAIAEFFIHLYLRQCNLKQEFLFLNLEEGSIKKGFDGYFSDSTEEYLVESKSGLSTTIGISHKKKLKEAYDDISSVISGTSRKSNNNPWRNAYNHASHIDVGAKSTLRAKIKSLSDMFDNGLFSSLENFNIIPCSSIFIDGEWSDATSQAIMKTPNEFFATLKPKSKTIKAICVTKATYNAFLNHLENNK